MNRTQTNANRRQLARNNPFSADRQESVSWIEPARGPNLRQLSSQLRRLDYRAAIVGPKGTGKTTLLKALEPLVAVAGNMTWSCTFSRESTERLNQLKEAYRKQLDNRVIFIDGIERLSPWQRFWLLRGRAMGKTGSPSGGLVVTTHRRFRALPVLLQTEPDFETLVTILKQLDVATKEVQGRSKTLFECHNGNIRLVLRSLYDQYAAGRFCDIDALVCSRP